MTSKMSDIRVPITVNSPSASNIADERNKSSASRDSSKIGPTVGRLRTMETSMLPEKMNGNRYPTVLMNGFNANRTGYFKTSFHSDNPLARAATT